MDMTTESNEDNEEAAGWLDEEIMRVAQLDREARRLAKRFGFTLSHRSLPTRADTSGHYDLYGLHGEAFRGVSLDAAITLMSAAARRRWEGRQ